VIVDGLVLRETDNCDMSPRSTQQHSRHAFTLIELIAVMVILAIMAGVAIPKYVNASTQAKDSADKSAIDGIQSAMRMAFLDHQQNNSPSSEYITSVDQIPDLMVTGELPHGIVIHNTLLEDQRGHRYLLYAETADRPARLQDFGDGGTNGWGY